MSERDAELEGPDKYTNAWYRQQIGGMVHILNRLSYEYTVQADKLRLLVSRLEALEQQRAVDQAEIGGIKSRLDAAAQVVAKMKKEPKG
jgi:hypothetical protein